MSILVKQQPIFLIQVLKATSIITSRLDKQQANIWKSVLRYRVKPVSNVFMMHRNHYLPLIIINFFCVVFCGLLLLTKLCFALRKSSPLDLPIKQQTTINSGTLSNNHKTTLLN